MQETVKNRLVIRKYETRTRMGAAAARHTVGLVQELLSQKPAINIIFPAAPSQDEILAGLLASDIDFSRINAFHMDEYLGLAPDAPQRFGKYLERKLFGQAAFRTVHYRGLTDDAQRECERYTALLREHPVDISLIGIGENGHVAFNDPHVADFADPVLVKPVELDERCRTQQVNDGCFPTLESVPKHALTLTIPALLAARYVVCTVPAASKCEALTNAVHGEVTTRCPASVLQNQENCWLFCDADSGKNL